MARREVFLFSQKQLDGPRTVTGYPDLIWKPFSEENKRVQSKTTSKQPGSSAKRVSPGKPAVKVLQTVI